jgi:hypothetical protein
MTTKSLLVGMAIFGSVAASHAAVFAIQGPTVNPANGHTYYMGSAGTWDEGEAFAVSLGGHLVTVNDAAENAWITTTFLNTHPSANPYMGLVDPDQNDVWTWLSGESVTYLNWAPGEPNFAWERISNFYSVNTGYGGQWNNGIPTDALTSIIEVVPEPSSLSMFALAGFSYVWARRSRNRS